MAPVPGLRVENWFLAAGRRTARALVLASLLLPTLSALDLPSGILALPSADARETPCGGRQS